MLNGTKKILQLIIAVLAVGFLFGIILIGMIIKQLVCEIIKGASDFYMNRINEIAERNNKVVSKRQKRAAKSGEKRSYKLDRIRALTAKSYAVAAKRKWLVFMIGLAIIAYFVFSSGGFGGLGGILEKVKSFF